MNVLLLVRSFWLIIKIEMVNEIFCKHFFLGRDAFCTILKFFWGGPPSWVQKKKLFLILFVSYLFLLVLSAEGVCVWRPHTLKFAEMLNAKFIRMNQ